MKINTNDATFEKQVVADDLDCLYFDLPVDLVQSFFFKTPEKVAEEYMQDVKGASKPRVWLTLELSTDSSRFNPNAEWMLKVSLSFGDEAYDVLCDDAILPEGDEYDKDFIDALREKYFKHEIEALSEKQKSQEYTVCPRCGGEMNHNGSMSRNAVSRRAKIDVCPWCGNEEALEAYIQSINGDQPKPYSKWHSIRKLKEKSVKVFDLYELDMYPKEEADEDDDSCEPSIWDWSENNRFKISTVYVPARDGNVTEQDILECVGHTNTMDLSELFCVDAYGTGDWFEIGYKDDMRPIYGLAAQQS